MTAQAAQNYLKTKVFTATPEQLQLMLYDGALRFGELHGCRGYEDLAAVARSGDAGGAVDVRADIAFVRQER